jgi:zinc transport system substrate-binding protein
VYIRRRLPRVIAGIIGLALTAGLSLAGCARPHTPSPDGVIRVVASFYPLQFVAQQVGGDQVRVTSLTQPGVEPHDLELSPRQVASVYDADLVVYLGGFQPAVDEATLQDAAGRAFDVADTVPLRPAVVLNERTGEDIENSTAKGDKDPHLWLDPTLLATVANALADRLAAIDPDNAGTYRGRAIALRAELSTLDVEYQQGLHDCARRDIVVSHAAFGYLAQRYRLNQIPITGLSPDAEPNPRTLAAVAKQAKAHSATTIFFESLASPKVAQTVAHEIGAKTAVLDPIEGLPAGSRGNYLSVMRQNLTTLETALGCR